MGQATHLAKRDYFEDPTLPLQVYIRDPQPEFPLHNHGFDELVVILRGTALHVIDGEAFPVRAGDVFVIAPHHAHEYREMQGLGLANILFNTEALKMQEWDIRALPGFHALFALEPSFRARHNFNSQLQLSERRLQKVGEMIRSLTCETEQRTPGYRVMATGLFMQLVVFLSRSYSAKPTDESLDLLRIGDAIAHIETAFAQKITLAALAQKACLSKRHFTRVFQACIGRSPIEHLMHVRVQKASELLKHTNRTITDIAYDCGFSDSNYFARCFRNITGLTPGQYRRS